MSSSAALDRVRRSGNAVKVARVLVNLRAQADAGALEREVRAGLEAVAARLDVEMAVVRLDSFAPSAPNPPFQRR